MDAGAPSSDAAAVLSPRLDLDAGDGSFAPGSKCSSCDGGSSAEDEPLPSPILAGKDTSEDLSAPGLNWRAEPAFLPNPNPFAPLVGILSFATDAAVETVVSVRGGGEEWQVRPPDGEQVEYPIVGLKPATTYELSLVAANGSGTLQAGPLKLQTPPLPPDFPNFEVELSDPQRMEPGMTMFAPRYEDSGFRAPIIIADHEGTVRWFYNGPDFPANTAVDLQPDRKFLFTSKACSIARITLTGEVDRVWYTSARAACPVPPGAIALPVQALHHEVRLLDNGDILALAAEPIAVDGYPTSEDDPQAPVGPATIFAGAILEFTEAGEVVKYIRLADLLDPTRIGRDGVYMSWPDFYSPHPGDRDWDHSNAVVYDAAADAYYVSLRHQDALIKIDRSTETLSWILGNPANWKAPWTDKLLAPLGDLEWQFHQHAVDITPLGLICYDNGNYRAGAFEPLPGTPPFSRAVIFSVDEAAMTVSQVWQYGPREGEDSVFAPLMGDANYEPETSNVLITHSSGVSRGGVGAGQIVEVTPEGERVFVMTVRGPTRLGQTLTATLYRSERISDIRY